jgi:hypothetical protein
LTKEIKHWSCESESCLKDRKEKAASKNDVIKNVPCPNKTKKAKKNPNV